MSSAILLQTSLEAIDAPYMPAHSSGLAVPGPSRQHDHQGVTHATASGSGSRVTSSPPSSSPPKGRRISPLPPVPTVPPRSGSSKGPQRYLFIAVRRGHRPGVYTEWTQAEVQLSNHPDPHYKTFSTRLAAEAFVAGWDGAGRHSLPRSSPRTLREHLAMSFPHSVASPSTSSSRRQSYHGRILAAATSHDASGSRAPLNGLAIAGMPTSGLWPAAGCPTVVYRHSMVKVSSPLRSRVDEEEQEQDEEGNGMAKTTPPPRRVQGYMSLGGLLSPPHSPTDKQGPVMDRQRPTKPRDIGEGAPWSARPHREFRKSKSTGLLSPPDSPVLGSGSSSPAPTSGGLWGDCKPATPSPLSPLILGPPIDMLGALAADGANGNPKKFSRSGLKKSGVVMPVAAPRAASSSSSSSLLSLSKRASQSSLFSASNASLVSVASTKSRTSAAAAQQPPPVPRKQASMPSFRTMSATQDRLASLAETSRRELQVNEHGMLDLAPPRPSFMRRQQSNSSLDSTSSAQSAQSSYSLTSGTSASPSLSPSIDEHDEEDNDNAKQQQYFSRTRSSGTGFFPDPPGSLQVHELAEIPETHEVMAFDHTLIVSCCTKSDGDADGSSSEGGSVKSGATGGSGSGSLLLFGSRKDNSKKGGGGLFKRFSKALKLDKKTVAGHDNTRRPSV